MGEDELRDRETVVVVGFTGASRLNGIHVARAEKGEVVYAGRIEHDLDAGAVGQLEALLRHRVISSTPPLKKGRGFAVKPGVLVDISHRGVTAGGVMRHPRFVRLRTDLSPRDQTLGDRSVRDEARD